MMEKREKSKKQIIAELEKLLRRAAKLEKFESQWRRLEEKLRESEDRFYTIFDSNLNPMIISRLEDGTCIDVNESFLEAFGYPREEILGRLYSELKLWIDANFPQSLSETMRDSKKSQPSEIKVRSRKGMTLILRFAVQQIELGGEKCLLTTGMNITQLRYAQEALEESEQRFRVLFDHAPFPIYLHKVDGTLVDINKAAEDFLDFSREELIGKNILQMDLFTADDLRAALANLEKNRKGKPAGPDLFTLRRKNGEPAYAELSTHPIISRGGNFLLGIAKNVTAQKKAEEERGRLLTQLQQAQKMEAIGTLAGGIAHDFNNILSAIIGYGDLIDMYADREDSNIRSSLAELLKACNRAKDLVQQILTFSRQTEQIKVPLDIAPVVKEVLKLLRSSLPTTIEIRHALKPDLYHVLADPTQIHQILMNLCANAGHAMQPQGGILKVQLSNVEIDAGFSERHPNISPGPHLKLTVSDTGHGLADNLMERIFDPYFTTKGKGEGTGLGLAVVHGIVKSHGGEITVKSETGEGTTFRVYLPVIKRKAKPEHVNYTPIPEGDERILFVDDEKILVNIGKLMLERLGYKVTISTSSTEALNTFSFTPDEFDLVITDMTMPNMTGDRLARKLIEIRPDIPIILCTGFSELITRERAVDIGIRDFLMKPLSVKSLAKTVRKVLDNT
jgi:PAS domain S-box-containing protein